MAILSLIFAVVFCPLGIIFGHTAKKQIMQTRERGEWLATAGLIIGYLELALILGLGFGVMGTAGGGLPLWKAYVLGIVEGVTEWLPVSSTGHLTIAEKVLGMKLDDPAVTGFTAVIQVGAILAAVIYFLKDIVRIVRGFVLGLFKADKRGFDYRFGWYVILGSVPIAIIGLATQGLVKGPLRNLWVVAAGLIGWSVVMIFAERRGTQSRGEGQVTWRDALFIGVAQCIALIPGVSRSGATISASLFRDLDRVTGTRLAFFLGIPALAAAGVFELKDAVSGNTVGVPALFLGTLVSFVVAYVSIAWLIRFVARHSIATFVPYRVGLGIVIAVVLATGALAAT
jgi:undecaprenyl-diphosphatase